MRTINLWHMLGCLGGLLLLTACDATIHEYPELTDTKVIVQTHIDRGAPTLYKELLFDSKWQPTERLLPPDTAELYLPDASYSLRLIVELYQSELRRTRVRVRSQQRVAQQIFELDGRALPPQLEFPVQLNQGNYTIIAWADYVKKGQLLDRHYTTSSSLQDIVANVKLVPPPPTTHLKDASAGRRDFVMDYDLSAERHPYLPGQGLLSSNVIPVHLHRPLARYKVVSTDYESFLRDGGTLKGGWVKVNYKMYVSLGFDAGENEPNNFTSVYTFTSPILGENLTSNGEILLMQDYVLASATREDKVLVDFTFYDAQGREISRVSDIKIPLRRNRETILKGPFLTKKRETPGSVRIDEGFAGEHTIYI